MSNQHVEAASEHVPFCASSRPVRRGRAAKVGVLMLWGLIAAASMGPTGAGAAENCNPDGLKRQVLPSWVTVPSESSLKTRGNVGELPKWYTDVAITPEQVRQVCAKGLKAAFLNWSTGAYNDAVLAGAKSALEAMGIKLVAVTTYNFDETQLATDVRNVMALKPDIIFYAGVDPTADHAALQPAIDAGVAVVTYANAPSGWTTGKPSNFVTQISYDTHGNGAALAKEVAKRYPNGGKLGMIFFDRNFKLVNEREKGFEDEIAKTNVKLVVKAPMSDPHKTQDIVTAMLARNPDINVIFAPWDLPADGVEAALNAAGRKDVGLVYIDLGSTGATEIACGIGPTFAMTGEMVYEWGRTGAIAAALHALGKPVPPYVLVPVFAVTKDNLEEGWNLSYGGAAPLPSSAVKCLKK